SDVRALREIAEESEAAAIFRAGEVADLERVLRDLLADPERRQHLARQGARWVRSRRSWIRNANRYYSAYRKLGQVGPQNLRAEAEIRLEESGVYAADFVDDLRGRPLPP